MLSSHSWRHQSHDVIKTCAWLKSLLGRALDFQTYSRVSGWCWTSWRKLSLLATLQRSIGHEQTTRNHDDNRGSLLYLQFSNIGTTKKEKKLSWFDGCFHWIVCDFFPETDIFILFIDEKQKSLCCHGNGCFSTGGRFSRGNMAGKSDTGSWKYRKLTINNPQILKFLVPLLKRGQLYNTFFQWSEKLKCDKLFWRRCVI